MNEKSCKRKLKQLMESAELKPLLDCLDKFSGECGSRSEQCMFWNNFLEIVNMIKSLVTADREGDFTLHMKAIQDLCPVFLGCGSLNYQRYATFYLEQLKDLKNKMPELLLSFMKEDFVVKRTEGSFNADGW